MFIGLLWTRAGWLGHADGVARSLCESLRLRAFASGFLPIGVGTCIADAAAQERTRAT